MQSEPGGYEILKTLLGTQHLAVVATHMRGRPYASLAAFCASDDLRTIAFVTSRATTKYRNRDLEALAELIRNDSALRDAVRSGDEAGLPSE